MFFMLPRRFELASCICSVLCCKGLGYYGPAPTTSVWGLRYTLSERVYYGESAPWSYPVRDAAYSLSRVKHARGRLSHII